MWDEHDAPLPLAAGMADPCDISYCCNPFSLSMFVAPRQPDFHLTLLTSCILPSVYRTSIGSFPIPCLCVACLQQHYHRRTYMHICMYIYISCVNVDVLYFMHVCFHVSLHHLPAGVWSVEPAEPWFPEFLPEFGCHTAVNRPPLMKSRARWYCTFHGMACRYIGCYSI